MVDYDKIINDITVEETEEGYRIEIKGDKELMKAVGFPERLTHFHERMQRFGGLGHRGWGGHRGHRRGWHGHKRHGGPHGGFRGRGRHGGRWARDFSPDDHVDTEEKPKRKRGDSHDGIFYV